MSKTISAGIVTAYGAAKKAGYTGTYEDFCRDQAEFAQNAQTVAEDRAAVESATSEFIDTTVPGAVSSVSSEGETQIGLVTAEGTAQKRLVTAEGVAAVEAVTAEGNTQINAVALEGATQIEAVAAEGTDQISAVASEGETQVGLVTAEGTIQTGNVTTAGTTQVSAVQAKGAEVIASIPQDYSSLTTEVTHLKENLDDVEDELNHDKTAPQGYILTATNSGKGNTWSPVGMPTAAQVGEAVDDWLDEHPEATTTVEDESLTLVKFKDGEMPFVTPEQFGAKGDGVTDDTQAWQEAVDSGFNVLATKKQYKCGQINVSKNITIDCNGAGFYCSGSILFNCSGSVVESLQNESNYIANQRYTIANNNYSDYTGFGMLKGTNNFEESRTYYRGGFVCEFSNGIMCGPYPINVEGTTIDIINPISITLRGVGEILHDVPSVSTRSINIEYGLNCVVENIRNHSSSGYISINFDKCLSCIARNLNIKHKYGTTGTNSYVISWSDSSYCTVENSVLYNAYWHCVTTGGIYLCYHNTVDNCLLKAEGGGGYSDHENTRNTVIKNTVASGIGVTGLSVVENVTIISQNDALKTCLLSLSPTTEKENAVYTVRDVRFLPDNDGVSNNQGVGVYFCHFPQVSGKTFHIKRANLLNVEEVNGRNGLIRFHNTSGYTCVVEEINIDGSNLDINAGNPSGSNTFDLSNYTLNISNIRSKKNGGNGAAPFVGINGVVTFNNINISNSDIQRVQGAIKNLSMSDVSTTDNCNYTISEWLYGSNIRDWNLNWLLKNVTRCSISNLNDHASGRTYFNLYSESGSIYAQRWNQGTLITEQITIQ